MTNQHLSEKRFADFKLPEAVLQGIQEIGFEYCTPIQAKTLTPLLEGKDIAGQAQTGTGKTAAFLVAMFAHLLNHPASDRRRKSQPRGFILAPTRELAIQIHKDAVPLNKGCNFKLALAYGGVDYEKQRKQISEGVDILIGTPGRIIDYHKQHVFDLKACQALVLDEADRMFDLGFIKDLRFLLRRCSPPSQRLSMLFSATLSYRVMELAYEHMNDPQKVEIKTDNVTADNVEQTVFYPANDEKIPLLIGLLNQLKPERSIVFTNTKRAAEKAHDWLNANHHKAAVLSGDVPQHKRQRLLGDFGEGKYNTLIATDVAARGLHIPDVSHIFNFDLPQSAEDYVHRIGRTARAGQSGAALSFACEDTSFYLPEIEAYIEQKIPMGQVTDYLAEALQQPPRRKPRPRPGPKHTSRPNPNKHSHSRNRSHRKPRPQTKTKKA
ncbi:MAG TPA: ATP-dependent RNA helicase RhlB [Gammaproteobacteria bacterium]|nr:ATP-dependent RNA helicase RhlB [Gammaproteobacteria bacterium]